MRIDLRWLDPNKTKRHKTEIYRSTHPFEDIDDAELIATVEPGITGYSDSNVIYTHLYYYRVRFVQQGKKPCLSETYEFRASPYTGPGPSSLAFGDEHFGYFGPIPTNVLAVPTLNQIRAVFGLPTSIIPELENAPLYKFAIGGSVRCTYQYPVTAGNELMGTNPIMEKLLAGEAHMLDYGLHRWAMIIPSSTHKDDPLESSQRFPGELRSMLGVITEMYARVEDAEYGNITGGHITKDQGQAEFFKPLIERYPEQPFKYIMSSDWLNAKECDVINWTQPNTTYPVRPKELHMEVVDFSINENWRSTLIWPVLIYIGLIGPR